MNITIHNSEDRGRSMHDWLQSSHSFSFADYYDSGKMGFGMLRVLNDDVVQPGEGFGLHPHNNMEIISIVLSGSLEHKDSMGNGSVIRTGDVQVMSAGIGVRHSEFNHSEKEPVNFLQLWIFPKEKNIKPSYAQKTFLPEDRKNSIKLIASGTRSQDTLYIHQDAALSMGNLEKKKEILYKVKYPGNGIYLFVIEGEIYTGGGSLKKRDAAAVTDAGAINIKAEEDSQFLIVEVPV